MIFADQPAAERPAVTEAAEAIHGRSAGLEAPRNQGELFPESLQGQMGVFPICADKTEVSDSLLLAGGSDGTV